MYTETHIQKIWICREVRTHKEKVLLKWAFMTNKGFLDSEEINPYKQFYLTRCIAELRGGCGSISNWDGVCPKFCICASMACRESRVLVIINVHQKYRSTHSLTIQAYPKSAMKKSPENSLGALLPGCRLIQVLVFCRQVLVLSSMLQLLH